MILPVYTNGFGVATAGFRACANVLLAGMKR